MSVEPIAGERTRFYVQSHSDPQTKHLVDLALYQGSGYCSCPAFSFTCEPNIKKGKPLYSRGKPCIKGKKVSYPDATVCNHLAEVHQMLLQNMLKRLATGQVSSGGLSPSPRTQTQSPVASQARTKSATAVPF